MMKPEQKIKLAVKPSQELIKSTKSLIRNGKTKRRVPYKSIIAVACCGVLAVGVAAHNQIFSLLGMETKCNDKGTKCDVSEAYAMSESGEIVLEDKLEEVKYEDLVFANGDTGDTSQLEFIASRLVTMADGSCYFDDDILFSEPTALLEVTVTSLERDEECDTYGLSVDEFLCGNLITDYDTMMVYDYRDSIPLEKLADTGSLMKVGHKYVLPVTAAGAILSVQPPIEITQDGMYMITSDWKSFGGRGVKSVDIGSFGEKLDYVIYLLDQQGFDAGLEDLKTRYLARNIYIPPMDDSLDYAENANGTVSYEKIYFANGDMGTSEIMDAIADATATMDLKGFSEEELWPECFNIVEVNVKSIHEKSYSLSNGDPYGESPKSIVYECSLTFNHDGSQMSQSFIIEDFFYGGVEPVALMKEGHIYVVPVYINDEETKEYDGLDQKKESIFSPMHYYIPPIEVTYHGNYVVPGAWKSLIKNSSFGIDASFENGRDYNIYDFKYVPREEFQANLEELNSKYFYDSEDSRMLEGRFVLANGNCLLACDDGELYQMSDKAGVFGELETGDEISVTYDGDAAETYPIKINVTECQLLHKGSAEDLSEDTIKALKELGWEIDSWESWNNPKRSTE